MQTFYRRIMQTVMAGVLLAPGLLAAETFGSLANLDQRAFLLLAKNLGAATHYKAVTPAEPLGALGLDVGLEVSSTEIDQGLFDLASDGSFGTDTLILPRVHAHKGLPFGLDIGAFLSAVPDTDLSIIGAELRLALIKGGIATPALALRASHSQIQGLAELDLNSSAIELTVSKGLLFITPYAGVGVVRTEAALDVPGVVDERFELDKLFVGVNINLGFGLTVEADRTGEFTTYSAKAGIRF